jgi:hypothetical protein
VTVDNISVDLPMIKELDVVDQVMLAVSQESQAFNFKQCSDALAELCSSFNRKRQDYNLMAPSLIPLEVKVHL